jgi:putative zinc finger/helix-turn-helix YgiT family protein
MVSKRQHDCEPFLEARRATLAKPYHFVESGLPNVYLTGVNYWTCKECGRQSADIPSIKQLMKAIARAIVEKEGRLTGAEIRFLRKRLGKKAAEFGKIVGVTPEQVSRWEHEGSAPQESADKLIRVFYSLHSEDSALKTKVNKQIEPWLSAWLAEGHPARIRAELRHEGWVTEPCPA